MEKKIEKFMEKNEAKVKPEKPNLFSRIVNHATMFHGIKCRTIVLPLCVITILFDEQKRKYIQNIQWSEARAKRYLDKWFLKIFNYNHETFCYYEGWHTSAIRPYALLRPWHWCERMFEEKYRNNIIDFMFNKYEVEGMKKTIVPDEDELDDAGYEKFWVYFKKEA